MATYGLLNRFKNADDDDGEDDEGSNKSTNESRDAHDDESGEDDKASKACKSITSLCQGWFKGAVDEFEGVAEDMTDEFADDMKKNMEEGMEEILNNSQAHLRTRVEGLKSILENNKADKKLLLVALKPLMKKTSATVKATNQAVEALAESTDSKDVTDVFFKDLQKDLEKPYTAWCMKGWFHSFNPVLNVSLQLRKTENELGHISEMVAALQTQITQCKCGSRIALCSQLHDTSGPCPYEGDSLRKLGKKMKEIDFPLKQQIDKEKVAINKIQTHQDQLLTGKQHTGVRLHPNLQEPCSVRASGGRVAERHRRFDECGKWTCEDREGCLREPRGFPQRHVPQAGAEEFGEKALQVVKAPTQAMVVAAQLTMMILVFMACAKIWQLGKLAPKWPWRKTSKMAMGEKDQEEGKGNQQKGQAHEDGRGYNLLGDGSASETGARVRRERSGPLQSEPTATRQAS